MTFDIIIMFLSTALLFEVKNQLLSLSPATVQIKNYNLNTNIVIKNLAA